MIVGGCACGSPAASGFLGGLGRAFRRAARAASRSLAAGVRAATSAAVAVGRAAAAGSKRAAGTLITLYRRIPTAGDLAASLYMVARAAYRGALAPALAQLGRAAAGAMPYAAAVLSFVPVLGTGVSAALGAATALAQGRPITDALIDAAAAAVPGGAIAAAAVRVGASLAQGKGVDAALLVEVRRSLPPAARVALDTGVALGSARGIQRAEIVARGAAELAAA